MFTTAYLAHDERRVHVQRAHRIRSAVVAGLIRDIARWVSAASR